MRHLLTGLLLMLAAACGGSEKADNHNRTVVAALAYADWCPNCQALEPKLEAVLEDNTFPDTSFVTLDFSGRDEDTFLAAADEAGVGAAVREQFASQVTTGLLLLVDPDTQEVVAVVDRTLSEDEIRDTIIAAASE